MSHPQCLGFVIVGFQIGLGFRSLEKSSKALVSI